MKETELVEHFRICCRDCSTDKELFARRFAAVREFGFAMVSRKSLEYIMSQIPRDEFIFDIGSGNGYFSFCLDRIGYQTICIDDGKFEWTKMWKSPSEDFDSPTKSSTILVSYPQSTFFMAYINSWKPKYIIFMGEYVNGKSSNAGDSFQAIIRHPDYSIQGAIHIDTWPTIDEVLMIWKRKVDASLRPSSDQQCTSVESG